MWHWYCQASAAHHSQPIWPIWCGLNRHLLFAESDICPGRIVSLGQQWSKRSWQNLRQQGGCWPSRLWWTCLAMGDDVWGEVGEGQWKQMLQFYIRFIYQCYVGDVMSHTPGETSNFTTDKMLILFWRLNLFPSDILNNDIVNLSWKNNKFAQSSLKPWDLGLHFLRIKISCICWINLSGYLLYFHAFLQWVYVRQMGEDASNVLHYKTSRYPTILQLIIFDFMLKIFIIISSVRCLWHCTPVMLLCNNISLAGAAGWKLLNTHSASIRMETVRVWRTRSGWRAGGLCHINCS